MRYIDLHTHSTASDGTDSPSQLVRNAAAAGLAAIALTDHDTISGLDEAAREAKRHGIEFIRGCELSTSHEGIRMHILGLWLPDKCPTLEAFLAEMRHERDRRNVAMIAKLQQAGVDICLEEVEARASGCVGRPHIAAELKDKGYVESIGEAFEVWLGNNGKAYVPKTAPRPEQAVRLLSELGASAIIAHPLLYPRPEGQLEATVRALKPAGLFGLEAWHSAQNETQSKEIIGLAQKYDLALSGGSDYHGSNKPGINLGIGRNNLQIPYEILAKMKARRIRK